MKKKFFIVLIILSLTATFTALTPAYGADGDCNFTSASGILEGKSVFKSPDCSAADLARFINDLNTFFYRLAIVLAVLMITIGGLQWLMAIGNSGKISNAKDTIQQAVIGLILALTAILLFNQIDTSFTNLNIGTINLVPPKDAPCEARMTAALCNFSSQYTCYWEPKDKDNYLGAGTCKPINCNEITKCEDYPRNEAICVANNNMGICNLKLHQQRCLYTFKTGLTWTDVCRTYPCSTAHPDDKPCPK